MADTKTIEQLDVTATDTAVKDFILAYLKHYQDNTLDILAQFPVDNWMSDINEFIAENSAYQPEEMQRLLFNDYRSDFVKILAAINPGYTDAGELSDGSWTDWYQTQAAKLQNGQ